MKNRLDIGSIKVIFSCLFPQAYERRNTGSYSTAKKLGYAAIVLNLLCVSWVMIWSVITVGLLTACTQRVGDLYC